MDIQRLCTSIRDNVSAGLHGVTNPHQRNEILIGGLYEVDRTVFPALGAPRKSEEYAQRQEAVVELISFLALQLIRGEDKDCRAVAVLSEIAEGCQDALLQKKLTVYAQELLAKPVAEPGKQEGIDFPRIFFLAGIVSLGFFLMYFAWPVFSPGGAPALQPVAVAREPARSQGSARHAANTAAAAPVQEEAAADESENEGPRQAEQSGGGERKALMYSQGETVTRIRVVKGQVLVPVTLKNGGESLRAELVLDTGSTRTAIHENLASSLRIDLKGARLSQSELADGRIVASRVARIDSISVGALSMGGAEVELIPYRGSDGLHDGLLGMDFLGKRRYQIDMEHEVIRWF